MSEEYPYADKWLTQERWDRARRCLACCHFDPIRELLEFGLIMDDRIEIDEWKNAIRYLFGYEQEEFDE